MTKLKYYISGPISGYPDGNKDSFYTTHKKLEEISIRTGVNLQIVNPHDLDLVAAPPVDLNPDAHWIWCMRRDIKALCDCDAVVLLPGWELSRGARMEVWTAHKFGMPFFRIFDNGLVEEFISIDDPEIVPLVHSINW